MKCTKMMEMFSGRFSRSKIIKYKHNSSPQIQRKKPSELWTKSLQTKTPGPLEKFIANWKSIDIQKERKKSLSLVQLAWINYLYVTDEEINWLSPASKPVISFLYQISTFCDQIIKATISANPKTIWLRRADREREHTDL